MLLVSLLEIEERKVKFKPGSCFLWAGGGGGGGGSELWVLV